MLRLLPLLLAAASMVAGCRADPEAQSGGDAYRHEAQAMPVGEWVTDDIALGDGDRTDWKAVDLAAPGPLLAELHADEPKAEVEISLYSRYGEPLGRAVRAPKGDRARLQVDARAAGRYFIRVRALDGPSTTYTLRIQTGGGDEGTDPPARPDF